MTLSSTPGPPQTLTPPPSTLLQLGFQEREGGKGRRGKKGEEEMKEKEEERKNKPLVSTFIHTEPFQGTLKNPLSFPPGEDSVYGHFPGALGRNAQLTPCKLTWVTTLPSAPNSSWKGSIRDGHMGWRTGTSLPCRRQELSCDKMQIFKDASRITACKRPVRMPVLRG